MVSLCASWAVLERATSALEERPLLFALCICCRQMGLCLLREVIDLWPWPRFICIPRGCICSRVKQLLETDFLPFSPHTVPMTSQQNCSHGLQLIMHVVVILAQDLICWWVLRGLEGKKRKEKVMSFHESSLITRNRKRNLTKNEGIPANFTVLRGRFSLQCFWLLKHSDFDAQLSMLWNSRCCMRKLELCYATDFQAVFFL